MKDDKGRDTSGQARSESAFPIIYLAMILVMLPITWLISIEDYFLSMFLLAEGGPIQTLTVIGYFLTCVTAIRMQMQGMISFGGGVAIIALAMGMREMDFHDRFTTMGITKSRFYVSDIVPLTEKIIAVIIVLSLAAYIGLFLLRNYRGFLLAVQEREKAALLALNGIVFIFLSKVLDSNPSLYACMIEETMECAIPYFFLTALLVHRRRVTLPVS